jgi:hypothetical protein
MIILKFIIFLLIRHITIYTNIQKLYKKQKYISFFKEVGLKIVKFCIYTDRNI